MDLTWMRLIILLKKSIHYLFKMGSITRSSYAERDFLPGMNELKDHAAKNIIYAGFVDDISVYFKGVDVFLNPVTDGGGIKTKLVEALGFNLNVVSTRNGAIGVDEKICNGKLFLCDNNDWQAFATRMREAPLVSKTIPPEFFQHFYWESIAKKAAGFIKQ